MDLNDVYVSYHIYLALWTYSSSVHNINIIGGKKLCSLCIIGVLGISPYLSLFSTDIPRELWIIRGECNDSLNSTYAVLENAIYSCITLLQGSELLIFICCAAYYLDWNMIYTSLHCQCDPLKLSKWFRTKCMRFLGRYCVEILSVAVYLLMMWLSVQISFIGYMRDKKYYTVSKFCTQNSTLQNPIMCEHLAIGYATLIGISLIIPCIIRIIVAVLFGFLRKYWKDPLKSLSKAALKMDEFRLVTDDDIDLELERRRIRISCIYARAGEKVQVICNVLEAWFMVQYLVYLLLLILDFIHIIRPLYERSSKNIFDLIYTALNITFDFFAFFLPYLMAVLCNKAHSDYYNALLEIYQNVKIKDDFWNNKLEEWYEKCPCSSEEAEASEYENLDNLHVELTNYASGISPEDRYYARSLQKIEKRNEFDFCPSFLGISIPISSPGYTFSVVLAFIAIIFNFSAVIV